jgi:hypothetical protein
LYDDAVLRKDLSSVFRGTPDETFDWLLAQPQKDIDQYLVCLGDNNALMSALAYMHMKGKES